jgi:uncharacterized protein (TIGR00369 family)
VPIDKATFDDVHLFMDAVPFNRFLGFTIEELDAGFAKMSVKFREELIGDPFRRALHGGLLSALIDTCGGAAVWTQCERGDRLSTVDLRVDYLRPGLAADVFVEGRVLRLGNRVGVAAMVAYHEGRIHEPVATGTAVYNVRRHQDGGASSPSVG